MVDKKISQLPFDNTPAAADYLPLVQASTVSTRAMTFENFMKIINVLSSLTAPATDDKVAIYDVSAAAAKYVELNYMIKEKLLANRTYYVRVDGNDSNDGLADSAGGAFLTIQHAVDVVASLNINGYAVTIQVKDGTYTGAVDLKNVDGFANVGDLVIQGNNGTPSNVIVSVTSDNCFSASGISVVWDIKDLKMQTTTSGNCIFVSSSRLRYGNVVFGDVPTASATHVYADGGSYVEAISSYTIDGDARRHWVALSSSIRANAITITLTGTPAFAVVFALCTRSAFIWCEGTTFTGSATGGKFAVEYGSVIYTGSTDASLFPGDSSGTITSLGQYVGVTQTLDGWIPANETWTYASASSVTTPGDVSYKYKKGDKIKMTQSAAVKYFYVTASSYSAPNTTINLVGGADYSVANVAISANYFSHAATPVGFPDWFNWTATFSGWSSNPAGGIYRFRLDGMICHVAIFQPNNGTSNSTGTFIGGLPFTSANITDALWIGVAVGIDNGSTLTAPCRIGIGPNSGTMGIYTSFGGGAWTNSGNKRVQYATLWYEIAA